MGSFINSTPGNKGGYLLAKPAGEIVINNVLKVLGGALFDDDFCGSHGGITRLCTNSVDCSSRSLWQMVQHVVDQLLNNVTLHDLVKPEEESAKIFARLLNQNEKV
jgi:DNA-binding IscR family transcriptional regulator